MKIYVSELPKSCDECPLHRSGRLKLQKGARYIDAETCVLGNFYKFQEIDDEIDTCPLETSKSLKQQAREEVVNEIFYNLSRIEDTLINCGNGKEDALAYFCEILKKVKGENDVKD